MSVRFLACLALFAFVFAGLSAVAVNADGPDTVSSVGIDAVTNGTPRPTTTPRQTSTPRPSPTPRPTRTATPSPVVITGHTLTAIDGDSRIVKTDIVSCNAALRGQRVMFADGIANTISDAMPDSQAGCYISVSRAFANDHNAGDTFTLTR